MRRRRLLIGLAGLAAAALAAVLTVVFWSAGRTVIIGGPLGPSGNLSTVCDPGQPGRADTVGIQNFRNAGRDTLVIDRVTLADPRSLRLAGAFIVPGQDLVGVGGPFPPPADQIPKGVQWAKRRLPPGTQVPPGAWISIPVGVEPTRDATGRSAGLVIWYHDGSTRYELRSNVRMVITVRPARCF